MIAHGKLLMAALLLVSAASTAAAFELGRAAAARAAAPSRRSSAASPTLLARAATSAEHLALIDACLAGPVVAELEPAARERVASYVRLLLAYNERTNVYSKSAYGKLPFHVQDSVTLALLLGDTLRAGSARRAAAASEGGAADGAELVGEAGGLLDMGSGSGLPSVVLACVHPDVPVYAVESKSRKTRFLTHAAREIGLPHYRALTCNVHELSRSWAFDVDAVTAKAFKQLPEVAPIAARCIRSDARLMVPISEAQVGEFELAEDQLVRRQQEFIYYSQPLVPSHGVAQRKLATPSDVPRL